MDVVTDNAYLCTLKLVFMGTAQSDAGTLLCLVQLSNIIGLFVIYLELVSSHLKRIEIRRRLRGHILQTCISF